MAEEQNYNISKAFFTNFHQLTDENNRPLTNIYWSHGPCDHSQKFGCVYLIHGYGGSPVEPCLKLPMQYALQNGFDVVALEGVDLSATAGPVKELNTMTLDRQKRALDMGLRFCRNMNSINKDYNIGWVHSISCRALSDLMIDSLDVRYFFDELVLNNPYFLAPPKVLSLREKLYRRDPSGSAWEALTHKVTTQMREIEHHKFNIPTCLHNLTIPLPPIWNTKPNFEELARIVSFFVKHLRLNFVLGTNDNMADYNQNMRIFQGLAVPNKQVISIQGANHSFENVQSQYMEFARIIFEAAKKKMCES